MQRRGHGDPTFLQPNVISMTNRVNRDEYYRKFGKGSRTPGIPRLSRLNVRPISVLHETPRVTVVGRNFSNGFNSNQFLLIHRQSREGIFIDASDDWPDDWIAFLKASRVTPTHIFLTHCHIDNVISLNAFLHMVELEFGGTKMGVMWNPGEKQWVDAFPRACQRYGRLDALHEPLPLLQPSLFTFNRDVGEQSDDPHRPLIGKGGPAGAAARRAAQSSESGTGLRSNDILLSSATNRSTSFYDFGPHTPLHYVFTPGHSPGHTILSVARERLLFTGDLLFYNQVGRVDLPWATGGRLGESLFALQDFPDETVLLPGHGRLTTLGRERRDNQALKVLYSRKTFQPQQEVSVGFNSGYL